MKKIQINHLEFYTLVSLYIIANDKTRGIYSMYLKQDIWIANMIGFIMSLCIFTAYYFIFKNMRYQNFNTMIRTLVGNKMSVLILLIYPIYFLYLAANDLRDMVEMNTTYLLDQTPVFILVILSAVPVLYTLLCGLEVFARVSQLLYRFLMVIFIVFSAVVLLTNPLHFTNLLPMFEVDLKTIFKYSAYISYAMPFGEMFVFLFVFYYIKNNNKAMKTGYFGLLTGGIILMAVTLYNLIILGPGVMEYDLTPAMRISKRIDIEGYIQRVDLITAMVLVCGSYVKQGILIFASTLCLKQVFKKINDKIITIALVIIMVIASSRFGLGENFIYILQFRERYGIPYIKFIFEVIFPALLFLLSFIRKPKKELEQSEDHTKEEENQPDTMTFTEKIFSLLK